MHPGTSSGRLGSESAKVGSPNFYDTLAHPAQHLLYQALRNGAKSKFLQARRRLETLSVSSEVCLMIIKQFLFQIKYDALFLATGVGKSTLANAIVEGK